MTQNQNPPEESFIVGFIQGSGEKQSTAEQTWQQFACGQGLTKEQRELVEKMGVAHGYELGLVWADATGPR